jgi:VWFA-related protein
VTLSLGAITSAQNPAVRANPPPTADAQTQPAPQNPTFRSSIQYVEVDARVLDHKGNPLRDLKKEDFRLLEDNVEQTIDTFTAIDIPIEIDTPPADPAGRPLSSDVATNVDQIGPQGRLFVVLLDDRQIDATRTQNTIRIVKQFIDKNLDRRDQTAILTTSGRTDVGRNFTSNKQALSKSVEGFMGRKPQAFALQRLEYPEFALQGLRTEHFQEAQLSLQALESVCNWLGQITGMTKSLIYVSEGLDYNYEADIDPYERGLTHGSDPWATEILAQERVAIAAATRANVTVFPVDPRGLGQDDSIVASDSPDVRSLQTLLRQEMERAHASLRGIALDTGGIEAVNSNNFDAALARIVRQSSSYYLLGYHPKNARREGRFRTIKLTVNRPGVQVVARRGYGEPNAKAKPAAAFAGPPGASPAVSDALNSPLPINEMTLSTTAVAFRGNDGSRASVAVIVESPSLMFTERDGKYVGNLEIIIAAVDDRNMIAAGKTSKIAFGVSAEAFQQIQKVGFRSLAELRDLKPGRYELRIAVANPDTTKRGLVSYPFEVPDFSKGKLQMSGLLVSSLAESSTPTGNPDKVLADKTTLPPTTVRRFKIADELTVIAEIYDNELKTEHRVDLTTTVRAADGTEAFSNSDWAAFDELTAANGAYRISMWVPLGGLAPGTYTVSIAARRTQDDDEKPVIRSIPITIVK